MLMRNTALCLAACAVALVSTEAFAPSGGSPVAWTTTTTTTTAATARQCSPTVATVATPSSRGRRRPVPLRSGGLRMSTVASSPGEAAPPPPPLDEDEVDDTPAFPSMTRDGVYDLLNAKQHAAFLKANPDKLMVVKFYAPWCRACKGVEPKFIQIKKDKKYVDVPIVFAQLSVQHNKPFVKSLGIMALPSIQMYAGAEGLVENFPCGPSKIPVLKRKLAEMINAKVDPDSMKLRIDCTDPNNFEAAPCKTRKVTIVESDTQPEIDDVISNQRREENLKYLRAGVPFFEDFDDDEFYELMDKANLVTFEQGDVIMRQGMVGRTFYVVETGEVEISVKTAFEDPLTTPPDYLGAVINTLGPHTYFGERSLITGQVRAASIRVTQKSRCFAFDVDDIPTSSVLSGKKAASNARMDEVNTKYGTDVYNIDLIDDQLQSANLANQARGSVNSPTSIVDEDTDEELAAVDTFYADEGGLKNENVISLLVRFQQMRQISRFFDYIKKTEPLWGDRGEVRRRSLLVSKLTRSQREEFRELFKIIDGSGDGQVSVDELGRAMQSVGQKRSDQDLRDMINKSHPEAEGSEMIDFADFMGVMAEAEFFYMFMDTFHTLDPYDTGYVMAGDLDRALCGVRDLVSDDRMSIIDVEDKDLQIDYESFADMLLGKPL